MGAHPYRQEYLQRANEYLLTDKSVVLSTVDCIVICRNADQHPALLVAIADAMGQEPRHGKPENEPEPPPEW